MRDDDSRDAWLKHKRTISPAVSVILLRSGIDLGDKSAAQISAIEQMATDAYLASSRRRLDQVTAHTWALLLLFGIFRNPTSEMAHRGRAREAIARMIDPVHDEVEAGIANYISRAIGRK